MYYLQVVYVGYLYITDRKGKLSSGVLFFFWVILAMTEAIRFRTTIKQAAKHVRDTVMIPSKEYKVVRDIKWSGNTSESVLWELAVSLTHSWDTRPKAQASCALTCHNSLRLSHSDYSVSGPQKCDFCKSHSRREYRVVHSSLAHSWDTGPSCTGYRALDICHNSLRLPLWRTMQCWPSESVTFANRINSTGI